MAPIPAPPPERPRSSPSYAAAFRCIGPTCEDTCCRNWNIPLDQATYEAYAGFPADKLGDLVSAFVSITPSSPSPNLYAEINLTPAGACAFFDADRLCRIQKEYGASLLSATCSSFPRIMNRVGATLEGSLSLSCPEAARNVLLDEEFLDRSADLHSGDFRTDNFLWLAHPLAASYGDIRTLLLEIVHDRSMTMSDRLLRIGDFCQRLEAAGDVAALVSAFRAPKAAGLQASFLENARLRVDVVLGLCHQRLADGATGRRFQDVFWEFVEGIGSPVGGQAADDVERFLEGERRYLLPFLTQNPTIQENFLENYMLQHLFPFGRRGSDFFRSRSVFDEYLLLATQFAWIQGLLAGLAMRHKETLAGEHVVKVVQSICRAVEHYPEVQDALLEYIREKGSGTLEGMAILLRS